MNEEELRSTVERWIRADPDAATQKELRDLLAAADLAKTDLADRFAMALEFGTAGLRGVLGAGPNRMNRAVVLRTTHGFAAYMREAVKDAPARGVVIGYDGRRMSREFAEDAACVLASAGIRALVFTDYAPTPLTAFAVTKTNAAAGIMITASHNPPEYNGYKAYWANGAQIVPPIDVGIAQKIELAPPAKDVPRMSIEEARAKQLVVDVPAQVIEDYLTAVRALEVNADGDRAIPIVYTPMHGVGDKLARRALAEARFTNVTSVPEQQEPDGAFPTVAFPNPEEKGAMDLSFALARKLDAELILANDPDADRLAVALPSKSAATGYVQLTGNQVGALLGHYLLTEKKPGAKPRIVLASIVSSPMLRVIAKALGVRYEETLTGFKWIANRAMDLERTEGVDFIFGYEEALGYTVGDVVRDKDGISAAKMIAEMCAVLKTRGSSLLTQLEALYREYGLFVSSQVSITKKGADGAAQIQALMRDLRTSLPTRIGAHDVAAILDYESQQRNDVKDGATSKLTLPKSNVLTFDLEDGSRVIARPSGTEPKVKFYFDVRELMKPGESLTDAETRANAVMKDLADAFVKIAMP